MSKKTVVQTEVETEAQDAQQTDTEGADTNTQTSGGNDGQQGGKVFTQTELNAIIQQRLEQERRKYADYDSLKQQIQQLQSSQQRLAELEQQNAQLASTSKEKSVEAAIAKAASTFGIDADAAYKLADLDKLQTDDEGNITNATDVVKAVAEKFPGLTKKPLPQVTPRNQQGGQAGTLTPEQKEAQFRREMFGGGGASFWSGGGVVTD